MCGVGSTKPSELLQGLFAVELPISPSGEYGLSASGRCYDYSILVFFRSRGDPHHTKSHSRQTKADYSTYSSSLGSSLLCLIQSLCTYVHISIGCYTAVKKRFPNPFLFICLEGRTLYNGGRRKMKDVIFTTELRLLQNLGMQLFMPIGLLGMKLHSKLGGFHVFLHKAVLKKSCSITLRY